ncbi:MAG: siphovirus Gp157 family protein [Christensenella sp.]|nr:siphovirus Gp157 family protein [Christensenella sp.]MEA5003821.1 siphovirus Gp157 family protein [Christensenella sp.]
MATLYELTENWQTVMNLLEEGADGEAVGNALADISGEIEEKADGYAKIIFELNGEAEKIKAEKDRLYAREQAFKNNAKAMKERLEEAMTRCGKPKFKTELFSFNIQKNAPSVVIEDEDRFRTWAEINMPEVLRHKVEVDKKQLSDALKNGAAVEYAGLKYSESLRIR